MGSRTMFSLKVGEKFIFNEKQYTVKKYIKKRMPRIGMALNLVTEEGQHFIHNWDIEEVKQEGL